MTLCCPKCKASATSEVVETRQAGEGIRRRRRCRTCAVTWATIEVNREAFHAVGRIQKFAATLSKHADQLSTFAATVSRSSSLDSTGPERQI